MTPMKRCQSLIDDSKLAERKKLHEIHRMDLPSPLFLELSPSTSHVSRFLGVPNVGRSGFHLGKSGNSEKSSMNPFHLSYPVLSDQQSQFSGAIQVYESWSYLWPFKMLKPSTEAIQLAHVQTFRSIDKISYMYLYITQTPESMYLSKEYMGSVYSISLPAFPWIM